MMKQLFYLLTLLFGFTFLGAQPTYFKVKIENVGQAFTISQSGVFNTPVGADAPGPLLPGGVYEFSFDAAPGSALSFATMFVQSNDLFFAPDEEGIALYDEMGNPVTGDLTGELLLWDAGTEANEAPGEGANQAPRQSGPNAGPQDPDNTVRIVNDDFTYPMNNEVIRFTIIHNGGTSFTGRIENVSTDNTLVLSDGTGAAVLMAPGVFVVHSAAAPLFTVGQPDRGEGLEAIAEDGNPAMSVESLIVQTGATAILAPGVFVVHGNSDPIFTVGAPDRGEGLEAIAEDGNPGMLTSALTSSTMNTGGAFSVPVGASNPGPALPGDSYEFVVASGRSGRLSFATMFVQSNDLFFAPDGDGIALFNEDGTPISGDITAQVDLWDAGTELNESPGIGLNQAPRQSGPNTGPLDTDNTVRLVTDNFSYPSDERVIRVTIMPLETTTFTVRVENVSTNETLRIDEVNTVPVPLSPGVWALHSTPEPLFTVGSPDRGLGLEGIAEDGDPGMLDMILAGKMGTPSGAFTIPVGADNPAPAFPGDAYEFQITAAPGIYLSLATMFVQSNDLFFAPDENGIPLFDENGDPISGDITAFFDLWDAGTEINEKPGVGANQAPRQTGPDSGDMDINDLVRLITDGFTYPADEEVIKVTINPQTPVPSSARLQIIHAANSQTVDVLVNGELLQSSFAYRTATPYIDVPANTTLSIELVPVNGPAFPSQVASFSIELEEDATYVAAVYGTFDSDDDFPVAVALLNQATETVEAGSIALGFFNGTNGVASIEVNQDDAALFENVGYGIFAAFQAFVAEDYMIDINDSMYSGSFSFWNGRSAVIFTTGLNNVEPWVALSNGGTYPLSLVNGLTEREVLFQSTNTEPLSAVTVYPNPTVELATIQYNTEKATDVSIDLVDQNGRVIRNVFNGMANKGLNQVTDDVSTLSNGVYYYTILINRQLHALQLNVN